MNDPEYSPRYPTKMQARYRYRYKQPASFLRDEHRRIVTEQNGRSETRKYLNAQIDHYNLRWRATERLMEQRTAILVGAVTATLIAVNAARQMTPVERTGIWLFDSALAFVVWSRVLKARSSICRNIAILNYLRAQHAAIARDEISRITIELLRLDGKRPSVGAIWSLPTVIAATVGITFALSIDNLFSWMSIDSLWPPIFLGATLITLLLLFQLLKSRAVDSRLSQFEPSSEVAE